MLESDHQDGAIFMTNASDSSAAPELSFIDVGDNDPKRRIAVRKRTGEGPGVFWLGGFNSDMKGTKAQALDEWAAAQRRACVRFDYSGHGESSGSFADGTIGQWHEESLKVFDTCCEGPQIVVGSSMGGWMALLLARALAKRGKAVSRAKLAGLVLIAPAPDFTEDLMWAGFTEAERAAVMAGRLEQPSDYSDAPYIITRKLIEEGRQNLVLRDPLPLPFPVRLLQGTADVDVPPAVALRLLDHAQSPDLRLTLVKGADHRFSTPECLDMITAAVEELTGLAQ